MRDQTGARAEDQNNSALRVADSFIEGDNTHMVLAAGRITVLILTRPSKLGACMPVVTILRVCMAVLNTRPNHASVLPVFAR